MWTTERKVTARSVCALLLAVAALPGCAAPRGGSLPVVDPNDNRSIAGELHGDTLVVRLRVQMARWYPDSLGGPFVDVIAVAEEGKAPQVPAPLLRVREGQSLDVTVANALADSTIRLRGLGTRPGSMDDSVGIAPGASHRFVFAAGVPGTYAWMASQGVVDYAKVEHETAAGAFVVDSAGATPDDRILVMNIWGEPADSGTFRNALAINGRSWPHTERLAAMIGDSVRWRVVNATIRPHPMHLHGFYYRVDSRGNGVADTSFTSERRRLVVTEVMDPFSTMAMTWVPERAGSWLFHCHIGFHVVPSDARLDPPAGGHLAHSGRAGDHMAGLVLGINVTAPAGWREPPRGTARQLRLLVQEGARRGRSHRSLGFVLERDGRAPAADSVEIPGTPLVLHVGEPTDITVVNRLRESTAVHWHGIELESYSDGVAGWSGDGMRTAPAIAPSDSFTARLTLKRPGTFMYHTHMNDLEQLTSGLYGPIIVLPNGARYDPSTDHLFLASWDGGLEGPPQVLVNGDSILAPLPLRAGVAHRFRFVNIGAADPIAVALVRDSTPVAWRVVANDGADLPGSQVRPVTAPRVLDVGQTVDFTWRPAARGAYAISIRSAGQPEMRRIPLVVR